MASADFRSESEKLPSYYVKRTYTCFSKEIKAELVLIDDQ